MLSLFSPEFSPTCRFFDRQERTWRELSKLFRACEFPWFALLWGCTWRWKALRSLAFGLPLSSAKRILISGVFRGSQKTRNQVYGNVPWVRIPPAPPMPDPHEPSVHAGFHVFGSICVFELTPGSRFLFRQLGRFRRELARDPWRELTIVGKRCSTWVFGPRQNLQPEQNCWGNSHFHAL